jgi:hypothetical protein
MILNTVHCNHPSQDLKQKFVAQPNSGALTLTFRYVCRLRYCDDDQHCSHEAHDDVSVTHHVSVSSVPGRCDLLSNLAAVAVRNSDEDEILRGASSDEKCRVHRTARQAEWKLVGIMTGEAWKGGTWTYPYKGHSPLFLTFYFAILHGEIWFSAIGAVFGVRVAFKKRMLKRISD